jgi:hypothetical protein
MRKEKSESGFCFTAFRRKTETSDFSACLRVFPEIFHSGDFSFGTFLLIPAKERYKKPAYRQIPVKTGELDTRYWILVV